MGRKPKGDKAMTAAERQKAYRDRKRGGSPKKHLTQQQLATTSGISRTYMYYARCVLRHRPDLMPAIECGHLKLPRAYSMIFTGEAPPAVREHH